MTPPRPYFSRLAAKGDTSTLDPYVSPTAPAWSRYLILLVIFCAILLGAASEAIADVSVIGSDRQSLTLQRGQGRLLRFDQPVSSVMVADPSVADVQVVSGNVVYLFGKLSGETNLIALDESDRPQASMRLRVDTNGQAVNETRHRVSGDTAIRIRSEGQQLVAEGMEQDVGGAIDTRSILEQYTPEGSRALDRTTYEGSPQINIRVRFAEVSRSELESYGIDWNALVSSGDFSFGLITNNNLAGSGASALSGSYSGNGDSVDALLSALQNNGLVRILAEPNITAVTGQTASFLAGGEIPIPVPVNSELVGIEYKRFGVSLLFTPTLLPGGRISMEVNPEVSSLVNDTSVTIAGYNIPALQVRSADTVVEVGSGQTFAIAGLFQRTDATNARQVPILGDIPILGELFQSRRYQRDETELVILLTPYIVAPSSTRPPVSPLQQARSSDAPRLAPDMPKTHGQPGQQDFGFYLDTGGPAS